MSVVRTNLRGTCAQFGKMLLAYERGWSRVLTNCSRIYEKLFSPPVAIVRRRFFGFTRSFRSNHISAFPPKSETEEQNSLGRYLSGQRWPLHFTQKYSHCTWDKICDLTFERVESVDSSRPSGISGY